ncbi:MAG: PD40 domain-containing protein, partial [Candidatus Coatesbacteria bacterium]
ERRLTRLQFLQDDLGDRLVVVPVLLSGIPGAAVKLADAYALDIPLLTGGPLAEYKLAGDLTLPALLMFDDKGFLAAAKAEADVPDRNEIAAEESLPADEGPPVPYKLRYTVRLVSGLATATIPVSTWTSTGGRVVFSGRFDGDNYNSLYEVTRAGKKLRRITTAEADDVHPTASPTGDLVFFASTRTGTEELWRCERGKGEFTRITKYFDRASSPSFSNDGALIIYERPAAGGNDLWLATPDGRRARRVDETYFDESDGRVWGDRIYFESDRYGNADIFSCDITGGKRRRLTVDEAADVTPAVSPDGRYVVWATDRDGDFDVWAMNADGSSKVQLTDGSGNDLFPCFSPGGREISFTRVLDGSAEIYKLTFEAVPDYDGPRPPRPLATETPS